MTWRKRSQQADEGDLVSATTQAARQLKRDQPTERISAQEIWTFRLPASLYGTPMTYRGRNGKQYVAAVTTGGFWGEAAGADDVTAFALP